jgi:hypothetical protein
MRDSDQHSRVLCVRVCVRVCRVVSCRVVSCRVVSCRVVCDAKGTCDCGGERRVELRAEEKCVVDQEYLSR